MVDFDAVVVAFELEVLAELEVLVESEEIKWMDPEVVEWYI